MRVGVLIGFLVNEDAFSPQVRNYGLVGVEDLGPFVSGDLGRETPPRVDGADNVYPGVFAGSLVVFAKAGGKVDYAGTFLGGDEVGNENTKSAVLAGEELEHRLV